MTQSIHKLASLHGIAESYLDYKGEPREVTAESQRAILSALGLDASSEQSVADAIRQFETVRWTRFAPPVVVARAGQRIVIPISVPLELQAMSVSWTVMLENGDAVTGGDTLEELETVEEGAADDRAYRRVNVVLPDLAFGYHTASLSLDTGLTGELGVIVAPERCFEAPAITAGQRVWGIAVQLYSLRSRDNWGIGDFRDLRELIRLSAPLGCNIIGLNPLHALMPANPSHISPYSPSNRQFLNVLYIAVEDVPEFAGCDQARGIL